MSPIKSINGVEAPDNMTSFSGVASDNIHTLSGAELPEAATVSVITTNLIQHLDAADSNSYGGTGTTWTDLSGQGHHLTLIGGPSYTSTGTGSAGGEFNFDGVDESARIDYADAAGLRISEDSGEVNFDGNTSTSTSNYNDIAADGGLTIQAWIKPLSYIGDPPNANAKHEASLIFSNNGHVTSSEATSDRYKYYQGLEFVCGRNSNLVVFYFGGNGNNASFNRRDVRTTTELLSSSTNGLGDFVDEWVNVAVTINDTGTNVTTVHNNIKFYVQGQLVGNSYIDNWADRTNEGTGPGLGYRRKKSSIQSEPYNAGVGLRRGVFARMTMSHLLQYNDVLTDAEILQNFNATKARHGY